MNDLEQHSLEEQGLEQHWLAPSHELGPRLSVLRLPANRHSPSVVMLHGLRDSAWSLLPIAQSLQREGFAVVMPELRGHGASERAESYAMNHLLLDLKRVIEAFVPDHYALFGHSLGGHVVSKYAALFPERVQGLILVEGLGPPQRTHEDDDAAYVMNYAHMLQARLDRASSGKPLIDVDDAAARLRRNNPRLADAEAARIATKLVSQQDGTLAWAFDSRANSVFVGANTADNTKFWKQVKCPTCVVSGSQSHEYWGAQMGDTGSGRFAEGEMEARAASFTHHEHHWFEGSGHMVHYDEPERLTQLTAKFLHSHCHS